MNDIRTPMIFVAGEELAGAWRRRLQAFLLSGFLLYTFVDWSALSDQSAAERVNGSPFERLTLLGLFVLAAPAAIANRRALLASLKANWGVCIIVGFCLLSILWSDYPELTLRRALFLFFVTAVAMSIAAGVTDLRRFHTNLFIVLVGIVICNFVAVVFWPSFAVTEIGARGLYSQKNAAGSVAMIAVVVGVTWVLGSLRLRTALFGIFALMPTALFLLLTSSKTSIGLTGLAILIFVCCLLSERFGGRPAPFILIAGFIAILTLFFTHEFSLDKLLDSFFDDASFTGRDELWDFALRSALERPWLGHGYGAFWDVGIENDPLLRVQAGTWLGQIEIGIINQAHNGYLELWLNIGLPITVLAVFVMANGCLSIGKQAISVTMPPDSRAALGATAMLLFLHLLHNLTEATLFMRGIAFTNLAILCLFVGARVKEFTATTTTRRTGGNPIVNPQPRTSGA